MQRGGIKVSNRACALFFPFPHWLPIINKHTRDVESGLPIESDTARRINSAAEEHDSLHCYPVYYRPTPANRSIRSASIVVGNRSLPGGDSTRFTSPAKGRDLH